MGVREFRVEILVIQLPRKDLFSVNRVWYKFKIEQLSQSDMFYGSYEATDYLYTHLWTPLAS